MSIGHTIFLRGLGLESARPIIRLKVLRGASREALAHCINNYVRRTARRRTQDLGIFELAVPLGGLHLPYDLARASERSKGPEARSLVEYNA